MRHGAGTLTVTAVTLMTIVLVAVFFYMAQGAPESRWGLVPRTDIGGGIDSAVSVASSITSAEQFVAWTAIINRFELDASELALERSEDPAVREFASRMLVDHRAMLVTFEEAVTEAGFADMLPVGLDAPHAAKLNELSGAVNFDLQFTQAQVEAHNTAIALFASFAQDGENERLRQFAAEYRGMLNVHRQMLPEEVPGMAEGFI